MPEKLRTETTTVQRESEVPIVCIKFKQQVPDGPRAGRKENENSHSERERGKKGGQPLSNATTRGDPRECYVMSEVE
jgi:hypothetical protein